MSKNGSCTVRVEHVLGGTCHLLARQDLSLACSARLVPCTLGGKRHKHAWRDMRHAQRDTTHACLAGHAPCSAGHVTCMLGRTCAMLSGTRHMHTRLTDSVKLLSPYTTLARPRDREEDGGGEVDRTQSGKYKAIEHARTSLKSRALHLPSVWSFGHKRKTFAFVTKTKHLRMF